MAITSTAQSTIKSSGRFNSVGAANRFVAVGGAVTESGGFRIHSFLANGFFEVFSGNLRADVLIVAGGGGANVGGGGGGRVLDQKTSIALNPGIYVAEIGAGGASGSPGIPSAFFNLNSPQGLGGSNATGGTSGAGLVGGGGANQYSGGGGGNNNVGGGGQFVQHGGTSNNRVYTVRGGNGGGGTTSSISGSSLVYGGGGGGRAFTGGGPHAGINIANQGSHAGGNRVNGGGGGQAASGTGFSGIVIVRYAI